MDVIYHLAPAQRWYDWPADLPYVPADYDAEGFVHCTAGDDVLLQVANRFYQAAPGDFVVLSIDPERLCAPLVWEPPNDHPALAALFPHIYGPIDRAAIVAVRSAQRAHDGRFLGCQA